MQFYIFVFKFYPIAYGLPAPGPTSASFLGLKSFQNQSQEGPKSCKNSPQEALKSFQKVAWRGLGEVLKRSWRGMGAILDPRRPQEPKSRPTDPRRTLDGPPLDPQVGVPNPLKIDLKAIQNLIIFLIACWIEFYSILVPTWAQLGTQNLPKIEPSWL